ncbi:MAG: NUDIX domain-containing protein [Candidatus Hodarchaeales archaeon]
MQKQIKHFTATTYLYIKEIEKILMIWHPSLKSWISPGGHIEENESPEETARREIREEVGAENITFFFNNSYRNDISDDRVNILLMPHFLIEEDIEENHFHMDWIFFATVPNMEYNSPEGKILKLFSMKDIEFEEKMFDNVKELAKYGFKLVENAD